jgi:hypothetical protein
MLRLHQIPDFHLFVYFDNLFNQPTFKDFEQLCNLVTGRITYLLQLCINWWNKW